MEWIFSAQSLQQSPSRRDNISEDTEKQYRRKTAFFLEELGKELKCDRFSVSTGLVFFHRFYALQSFKGHSRFIMSATCLFLATKAEESPRKLYDIVYHFCKLRQKCGGIVSESERNEMPTTILLAERILLQTLCFDLQIVHPYKACLEKIRLKFKLHIPDVCRKEFNQLSVNFINDSYRTALCIEQPPSVIASGALFLAALQLGIRPVNPNPRSTVEHTWFALLESDIEFDVLQSICLEIVDLIEEESRSNPGSVNDGKGALLRNRLETYNAINSIVVHHPSPTTVAIMPPQILNTKDHINITDSHLLSHSKPIVKEEKSEEEPTFPDYPYEDSRKKQIKISYPLPSAPSSYTIHHPPPVPSPVYRSPSSLASATPPPPPPETPSSSFHYSLPDTPNYAPPPPPDTPDSCQSTPAPPPPPAPYDQADQSDYESQAGTPAPPPPPTPDYTGTAPSQTLSATKLKTIVNIQRRPFHQLEADVDFHTSSPKKRRIE